MSAFDVVVLGEALWDVYPVRAGQTIRARRREQRCLGGAPANVAVTLARLGLRVAMLGTLGDDPLGEGLRDELDSAGVDTARLTAVRGRTGITFVELGTTPRYVPFRHPSADMLLDATHIPARLDTRWIHVGSSSFARPESAAATRLAIARADAEVSFDLNVYRHLFRGPVLEAFADVLASATVVKASEPDLAALDLDADGLCALRPERLTVLTHAERGATARIGERVVEHRPRPVRAIDPIGAGDAFMAGLLAALVVHGDLDAALSLGSRLGARAVTALGATTALTDLDRERRALARAARLR